MKFMHIADCHVGCRMYGMEERELDFYKALSSIAKIAIDEHVDCVVVSGDLFDSSKPPARAVCEVTMFVDKLKTEGIDVVGIEGNHDRTGDNYWLRVCGIWPLDWQPYENSITGATIAGFNWSRADEMFENLEQLANASDNGKYKYPVVALHVGLAEMGCGFNPDASALQLVPYLKRIGCKYLALGHIHIPMEQFYDGISFVQPGSIELKSIDEPQDKSVEIVEIEGDVVRQKRVPYATRPVKHYSIDDEKCLEELRNDVDKLKSSFVVAYVSGAVEDGVNRVGDLLKSSGVLARVVPVGDGSSEIVKSYDRGNAMNLLKDAVLAYFPEGSKQYETIMKIISTGEPRPVIKELMEEKSA